MYSDGNDGQRNSGPSTPRRTLTPAIFAREALPDQHCAERHSAPLDDAQLPAVAVDVALDRGQREGAGAEERVHLRRRRLPETGFAGAARRVSLRRVDVGDADLRARHPDRVAVDDAVGPLGVAADRDACGDRLAARQCGGDRRRRRRTGNTCRD